jgi:hydroxymethylpyrimidine/phosphomethylpyrimidine kinase
MNEEFLFQSDVPVVLSIGGSDSGGGAGIQADLKTYASLGVYGTTVITCVTAQTPAEIRKIEPMSPDLVTAQIRAVSNGFPIAVAKTGMLYSDEIIERVARADINQGIPILVVDPVMVAASGARLLQPKGNEAMRDLLLPLARVVTPNVFEAEILTGHTIASHEDLKLAAREIGDKFDVACVVKGGHLEGEEVVDVLYDEGEFYSFVSPRIHAKETHGAGCVFSASLAAYLAHGHLLTEAVRRAKAYVSHALEHASKIGHHAPMNLFNPPE